MSSAPCQLDVSGSDDETFQFSVSFENADGSAFPFAEYLIEYVVTQDGSPVLTLTQGNGITIQDDTVAFKATRGTLGQGEYEHGCRIRNIVTGDETQVFAGAVVIGEGQFGSAPVSPSVPPDTPGSGASTLAEYIQTVSDPLYSPIAFTQSGTGAVARTVSDKLKDAVSVKDFGAKGDGVTDDTAAIQAAATYAATLTSGRVHFPAGTYKITAKITFAHGVEVFGPGTIAAYTSQLFEWTGGSTNSTSVIDGISILANAVPPNDGTGFALYFNAANGDRKLFELRNVSIMSSDGITRTYGFDSYIKINNAIKATLSGLRIDACFKALSGNVLAGQYLQNAVSVTGVTTQLLLEDFLFASIYRGVYITGSQVEGPRITNGDMVGVYYGIDAPAFSRPGFWVDAVHINAVRRGIFIEGPNAVDVTIRGLWLYRSNVFFTDTDWTGIHLKQCSARTQLSDIATALSITSDTQYGLKLENCTGVNAHNLALSQANNAIYHVGTNTDVNYDNVVFNGLGTGTAFATTTGDTDIWLGKHQFLGSVGTKYSIASQKTSIRVEGNRPRYNRAIFNQTVSAAGTSTFNAAGTSLQVQGINFSAGSGPYTYNLDFDTADAYPGDVFELTLNLPGSANPTVVLRNGLGGTTLKSIPGIAGTSKVYDITVVCDYQGNWNILRLGTRTI